MDDGIKCDICEHSYHKECCGLSKDVFDVLPNVIDLIGWVCTDCRSVLNTHNGKLQTAVTRLTEQLADVHISLAYMKSEIVELRQKLCTAVDNTVDANTETVPIQCVPMVTVIFLMSLCTEMSPPCHSKYTGH